MQKRAPNPTMVRFWEIEMNPVLGLLGTGQYSIDEVEKTYQCLVRQIGYRYRRPWKNFLDDQPAKGIVALDGSRSPMTSSVIEKEPVISIFIPEWVDLFLNQAYQYRELFETTFVIGYLHEMIHLASGLVHSAGKPIKRAHMLYSERLVWARTCQEAIGWFVAAGRQLLANEEMYWRKWLEAQEDANHPAWITFIEERYRNVRFL